MQQSKNANPPYSNNRKITAGRNIQYVPIFDKPFSPYKDENKRRKIISYRKVTHRPVEKTIHL